MIEQDLHSESENGTAASRPIRTRIWARELTWRIGFIVFATILIVMSAMAVIPFSDYLYQGEQQGTHGQVMRTLYDHPEGYSILRFKEYTLDTFKIILGVTLILTLILMVVFSKWLIEPLMFLRDVLRRTADDPDSFVHMTVLKSNSSEINEVFDCVHHLINENATNLKKLKAQAKSTIHQLAYYDALTGLPNRTMYVQAVGRKIEKIKHTDRNRMIIAVLDIDHFKDINDTAGHHVGDLLLAAVGKRLREKMPSDAFVARSGEDEFAIAFVVGDEDDAAENVGKKIVEAFIEPFTVLDEIFQIRGSLGIARYPQDGNEASKLLKSADIALNRAKEDGRDTVRHYTEDFDKAVKQRFLMIRDLRNAMALNQFELYYQPQFDMKTGKIIGAEALLRWLRPDENGGEARHVPPVEFIPAAEQSGLIVPIGEWVLQQAVEQCKKWHDAGYKDMRVAVNISAVQFAQENLTDTVAGILARSDIDPKFIELEVTETVFMDDISQTIDTLKKLHNLGLELAIDDFGTGYSSLNYLRRFPIDRLKIDQSFIRNAHKNIDDAAIARTVIALGHALGLKVLAEGVETKEHEEFLKSENCDEVQGYLYARPMPVKEMDKFLQKHKTS